MSEVTLAMGGHELQPSSFARSLPPARICETIRVVAEYS